MAVTPDHLWRGVHAADMDRVETQMGPVSGVLCPTVSRRSAKSADGAARARDPEVMVVDDMVQPGGGTSLFNRDRFFGSHGWRYFYVPRDTPIPPMLSLTGPDYDIFFDAELWRIEARKPVPVAAWRGALDNFARAAFARRYVDARSFTGPGR